MTSSRTGPRLFLLMGCAAALLLAACSGGSKLGSSRTADLVRTSTESVAGPIVVDVYAPLDLQTRPSLEQQTLPLEATNPEAAGSVREVTVLRTREPVGTGLGTLRAFTACENPPGAGCQPERVLLFFTRSVRGGQTQFGPERERRLRIEADGVPVAAPAALSYDEHGYGTAEAVEELWVTLPYAQFEALAAASRVVLDVGARGGQPVVLDGLQLKVLRALQAAVRGQEQIDETAPAE